MKSKQFVKDNKVKETKNLSQELPKLQEKLHQLKMDLQLGKLKNYREIRQTKRQVAQIMTILSEKVNEMVEQSPGNEQTKEKSND